MLIPWKPSLFDGTWPQAMRAGLLDGLALYALPKEPPPALSRWLQQQVRYFPFISPAYQRFTIFARNNGSPILNIHFLGGLNQKHQVAVELLRSPDGLAAITGLTQREVEVLKWICAGKNNPEIALILDISINTVRNHVASILDKLMVENRMAAATMAHDWFSS